MNRLNCVGTVIQGGLSLLAFLAISTSASAQGTPITTLSTPVTVDTSAVAGADAFITFDMFGSGNTATINDLAGESSVVGETPSGLVSGSLVGASNQTSLAVNLNNFFSEDVLEVTLGTSLSFEFSTTNKTPPVQGAPDEFSFYIFDANYNSLLPTSDPTGAQALFTVDIPSDTAFLTNYSSAVSFTESAPPVPNPPACWMLFAALPFLLFFRRVPPKRAGRMARWSAGSTAALTLVAVSFTAHAQSAITGVGQDPNISVGTSGYRINHATKTLVTVAQITNNSPFTINGPFYLGVIGTSVPGISLNGTGNLQDGNPYSAVAATSIAPGQTVTTSLSFYDPNNAVFSIDAAVYDAASAPPTATLSCPGIGGVSYPEDPYPLIVYTNPTDSLGRNATCTPVSGTQPTAAGPFTLSCISSGGPSQPASCSSPYITIAGTGTININIPPTPEPPLPSYVGLIPCASLAAAFAPGSDGYGYALNNVNYLSYCDPFKGSFHPVAQGSAAFTVWNYGLYDVKNATVKFYSPPGIIHTAVVFSPDGFTATGTGGSCNPPTAYNQPGATTPGTVTSCQIIDIPPNAGVDVGIAVDTNSSSAPNVSAQLLLDPTQNTNTDTTNTSIQLIPAANAAVSVQVPASIGVQSATTCNFSHEPGFLILLDTCGVPPLVNTILVSTLLGAASLADVFGDAALEFTTISETTLFKWVDLSEFDNIR